MRFGKDFHFLSNHKGRVEPKTEVANKICTFHLAFVFLYKLFGTWEGHLVDVFVNLFCGHTNTTVDDAQRLCFFIHVNVDGQVAQFPFSFAKVGQRFKLLCSIYGIGNKLA